MLNKILSIILSIAILISPAARAEDFDIPLPALIQGEVDPGYAISPMKKGQKAPFSGVLLSPGATAEITVRLNSAKDDIRLEVNKVKLEMAALNDLNLEKKRLEYEADLEIIRSNLEFTTKQKDAAIIALEIEKEERPSKTFWFSLGTITGIGLSLTILFAAKELR